MPRIAHSGDFNVDVEGVGRFTFGRRTQRDQYRIRGLYSQMTGNHWRDDGRVGDVEAWMHANIEVLTVQFPDGFSLEKLDPLLDAEDDNRLERIYNALRAKELSFRQKPAAGSANPSSGDG
jgi:hypothetical protein